VVVGRGDVDLGRVVQDHADATGGEDAGAVLDAGDAGHSETEDDRTGGRIRQTGVLGIAGAVGCPRTVGACIAPVDERRGAYAVGDAAAEVGGVVPQGDGVLEDAAVGAGTRRADPRRVGGGTHGGRTLPGVACGRRDEHTRLGREQEGDGVGVGGELRRRVRADRVVDGVDTVADGGVDGRDEIGQRAASLTEAALVGGDASPRRHARDRVDAEIAAEDPAEGAGIEGDAAVAARGRRSVRAVPVSVAGRRVGALELAAGQFEAA
jgi:hypothetical protein